MIEMHISSNARDTMKHLVHMWLDVKEKSVELKNAIAEDIAETTQQAYDEQADRISAGIEEPDERELLFTNVSAIHGDEHTDAVVDGNNHALWLEFGSGVYYNPGGNHPKAAETGMVIGSFGKGHGNDPNGWYYKVGANDYRWSRGYPASCAMYNAAHHERKRADELAAMIFEGYL